MRRAIGLIASLLLLVLAVGLLRAWGGDEEATLMTPGVLGDLPRLPVPGVGTAALALGLLLVGSLVLGEITALAGLPRVSGALLFGLLTGPNLHAALAPPFPALVPQAELDYLQFVDALAVSLIGLVAGGEIRIEFLRRSGGMLARLVAAEMSGVLPLVGAGLAAFAGIIPLLSERGTSERWYLVAVLAAMTVANSPAIVTAMLRETRASGPFAHLALSITVVKDLTLVIIVSALLAGWSTSSSGGGGAAALGVTWHLAGSLLVGAVFAAVLAVVTLRTRGRLDLLVVVVGFSIALAGRMLSIAPLLAGITAGFALANAAPNRSRRLFNSIDDLLPATYALFFAVAGARIGLSSQIARAHH